MSGSRTSIYAIPDRPTRCPLKRECVYRTWTISAHPIPMCDEPRINKRNGDAACHRMTNKALLAVLKTEKGE